MTRARPVTSTSWAALLLVCVVMPATAVRAQDAATVQLQQEVLELKRVNQQLERRIESLERLSPGAGGGVPATATSGAGGAPASNTAALRWLNTAEWERLKPGMPELEVIRILGVPNSLRGADGGRQVIYYALEIGTGSFLSGSVALADHRVVEVRKPTLR